MSEFLVWHLASQYYMKLEKLDESDYDFVRGMIIALGMNEYAQKTINYLSDLLDMIKESIEYANLHKYKCIFDNPKFLFRINKETRKLLDIGLEISCYLSAINQNDDISDYDYNITLLIQSHYIEVMSYLDDLNQLISVHLYKK